ncbi:DUF4097 family beta strand repeat-containing protein [Paenibacillus harenae]|uniref:DUF4097 domain-containing protein n=1 Tax=Paenibacillus harenae TaxID=306543 RepID=A0ABT9U7J4_PAEHA|nr:DUF4097 family beta strand repeat-containing protein [Paenibacillus harenae]MDQ0115622.1 hypothetical protein [Paenibacillus harenae]
MGKLGVTHRKRRWLAAILAFLLPGTGHLYAGQYPKGLLLLAGYLLDVTAIIRLADSDGGRHLLLIVYLGLMLPVFYFLSVYDSLQTLERDDGIPLSASLSHGIALTAAGGLLFLLVKPPDAILPWMNELAELSVGPVIIAIAVVLLVLTRKRLVVTMFKLGRYTAAVLIVMVGALLLWDQIQGRNDIALLGQWWPVIFIMLGIEMIIYSLRSRKIVQKLRLDFAGISVALVISLTAYVVTQYADFPFKWLDQWNVDISGISEYGEETGYRYDKTVVKVPLDENISHIRIVNPNGQITVRSDDVEEMELLATVWVDVKDQAEADSIAEQSTVKVTPGDEVAFEAKGQAYGANGSHKPRMNLTLTVPMALSDQVYVEEPITTDPPTNTDQPVVTDEASGDKSFAIETIGTAPPHSPSSTISPTELPESGNAERKGEQNAVKLNIEAELGAVDVSGLLLPGGLDIRISSGNVKVGNVVGEIQVKGINGNVELQAVNGDSSIETKNGTITATGIKGQFYANTLNGSLELQDVGGDIEAETKNGKIKITGAGASLKADTLNGTIEVNSNHVGGDWDLDSSVGEIKLALPEHGDFAIYGSVTFGNITSDFPFDISKKTIRGSVGTGTHRIQVNANNSISVKKARL